MHAQDVTIVHGTYRNRPIQSIRCQLLRPIKLGARGWFGNFDVPDLGVIRVQLKNESSIEYHGSTHPASEQEQETDEQIIERIEDRFAILEEITAGVAAGEIRSLIVSGAPGIGKSAGITNCLEQHRVQHGLNYHVVSGTVTSAFQLYQILFENSEPESVLVLDDCDSLLFDDTCINLLKAALESGNRQRMISYLSQSVENIGLPKSFEFQGSVIFITNVEFQRIIDKDRAAIAKHLAALQDRSLYLDLTLHSRRDIWCRIKSMVEKHHLVKSYTLTSDQQAQLLDHIQHRQNDFRSLSLRTVLALAQFMKTSPNGWRRMSEAFQMKSSPRSK